MQSNRKPGIVDARTLANYQTVVTAGELAHLDFTWFIPAIVKYLNRSCTCRSRPSSRRGCARPGMAIW